MHERIDFVELLTGRFTIFFFVGTAENGPFKVAPSASCEKKSSEARKSRLSRENRRETTTHRHPNTRAPFPRGVEKSGNGRAVVPPVVHKCVQPVVHQSW